MVASVSPVARPRGRRTAFATRAATPAIPVHHTTTRPLETARPLESASRLPGPESAVRLIGPESVSRPVGHDIAEFPPAPARTRRAVRALRRIRAGHVLAAAGLALLPWIAYLASRMPSGAHVTNWSAAWIGLDAMLAVCLVGTGLLALRRDPRLALPAAATAALLIMDAWFDVLTSAPGGERAFAAALAGGVELPVAVACAVLAFRAFPKPAARTAR